MTLAEKIKQKIEKLQSQLKVIDDKEKTQITEWTSISKTEEISKQIYNNKTYAEILPLLKKGERIADYPLLQKLRNSGKYEFLKDFWVFVPNPDKISLENKYVARFSASSGRASLSCSGDPGSRNSGLGVFVVRKKKQYNPKYTKEAEEK